MECLILNGNPAASDFDAWLDRYARSLEQMGHTPARVDLRDRNIGFCTGCWACWWRTPGLCALKDDMEDILPAMARADLVVWASPLVLGAPSALLKTAQDRFIPLAHPYILLDDGECHHRHRYDHNADIAFVMAMGPGDTPEDGEIAGNFFRRYARNTRTALRLVTTTEMPPEEAAHASSAV